MTDRIGALMMGMGLDNDSNSDIEALNSIAEPNPLFKKNRLWQQRFIDLLDVQEPQPDDRT